MRHCVYVVRNNGFDYVIFTMILPVTYIHIWIDSSQRNTVVCVCVMKILLKTVQIIYPRIVYREQNTTEMYSNDVI